MKANEYEYRERLKNEIITFCYENYEQRFVDASTRGEYFKEYYDYTLISALNLQLPENESTSFMYEIKQTIKNIKNMIGCSIDAKDGLFKSSEIWKILRGLQLLGIKCNKISVEEMERCLDEVKKSADLVKSVAPYDFPAYTLSGTGLRDIKTSYFQAYIEQYQNEAWGLTFGVFDPHMLIEKDYRKLQVLAESIYYKMYEIETRKGNIETVNEVNQKLMELKDEALQITERINNGEISLRKAWHGENTYVLSDYELPSNLAMTYLIDCFHVDNEVFSVDAFHEAIANGEYDLIFNWDEDEAYKVTEGNNKFISHIPSPASLTTNEEMGFVETYCTARLNGFHEYLLNRIRLFIGKLVKLENTKEFDSLDNPYDDLLKFTVDYINNIFLK